MAGGAEMKIKMPLERALYCPKHGRQSYYISHISKKPGDCAEKFCDRTEKHTSRSGGEVVAFVSKRGKITYADRRIPKRVWENDTAVLHSTCMNTLTERMVMPKYEDLLRIVWRYEWGSKIWRGVPNGKLSVSGPYGKGKTWHVYLPQFNTYDNNKPPTKKQKKCWVGGYKTRLKAMKAAIENWNRLCKECEGSGRHCKKVDCNGPCAKCPPHPTGRTRSTGKNG